MQSCSTAIYECVHTKWTYLPVQTVLHWQLPLPLLLFWTCKFRQVVVSVIAHDFQNDCQNSDDDGDGDNKDDDPGHEQFGDDLASRKNQHAHKAKESICPWTPRINLPLQPENQPALIAQESTCPQNPRINLPIQPKKQLGLESSKINLPTQPKNQLPTQPNNQLAPRINLPTTKKTTGLKSSSINLPIQTKIQCTHKAQVSTCPKNQPAHIAQEPTCPHSPRIN